MKTDSIRILLIIEILKIKTNSKEILTEIIKKRTDKRSLLSFPLLSYTNSFKILFPISGGNTSKLSAIVAPIFASVD